MREAGEIVTALAGTAVQAERLVSMAEKGFEYGVKTRLEVDDAQLNLSRRRGIWRAPGATTSSRNSRS